MRCGYSLDAELIFHPTSPPDINLSKNIGKYVENTNKKSSFYLSSSKINKYYFIIFLTMPILDLKFPLMVNKSEELSIQVYRIPLNKRMRQMDKFRQHRLKNEH